MDHNGLYQVSTFFLGLRWSIPNFLQEKTKQIGSLVSFCFVIFFFCKKKKKKEKKIIVCRKKG